MASVCVLTLALAGCGDGADASGTEQGEGGRITVVASTNVWGSVVQAVGGSAVSVRSLINDASSDPHAQSDKPEDAAVVAGADLVVYNGGGYDEFFTKLLDATGTSARKIDAFDLSGHPDGENEHVWYDLPTVKKVADTIAEQLGAVDPSRKSMFDDNAAAFGSELGTLAGTAAEIGDAHPGTKVVATEPVAKYLLDTAGLTDATPDEFSGAIEEETDPPVVAVVETTNLIKNKQVGVLVNNIQTETPITNSLAAAAKNAGVPIVDVSETLPQGVTDYVKWMTKQVDALSRALAG